LLLHSRAGERAREIGVGLISRTRKGRADEWRAHINNPHRYRKSTPSTAGPHNFTRTDRDCLITANNRVATGKRVRANCLRKRSAAICGSPPLYIELYTKAGKLRHSRPADSLTNLELTFDGEV